MTAVEEKPPVVKKLQGSTKKIGNIVIRARDRIIYLIIKGLIVLLGIATLPVAFTSLIISVIKSKNPFGLIEPPKKHVAHEALYKGLGESKEITLKNNIKLHYVEQGNAANELLLLLHGFPDFWFSWREQINVFKDRYHVVAVDQRGYNLSTNFKESDKYKLDELVEDVKLLIDALGKNKAVIIGHDWGGIVFWSFLLKYPEYVSKYVVLNIAPPYAFKINLGQFFVSWYIYFFQLPILPEYYLRANDLAPKYFNQEYEHQSTDIIETYKSVFQAEGAYTGPVDYYRANVVRVFLYILLGAPEVQKITFPKGLVLYGEKDKYILPASFQNAEKILKNVKVEKVDGNHFAHQQVPIQVNEKIDLFLKDELHKE